MVTWMEMKQLTKTTVLQDVMTTTLTIKASTKCVRPSHISIRQLELHKLSSVVRGIMDRTKFPAYTRNRNSEVIDIKDNFIFCTHRGGANLVIQWTQFKYDIFIIDKSFFRTSFEEIRFITLHNIYSAWQHQSLAKTFVDVDSRENRTWRNGTIVTISSSVSPHC